MVTPSLMFVSLALIESMNPYFAVPFFAAQAFSITQYYSLSRSLETPMWMARQMYILGLFSLVSVLMIGYKIINIRYSTSENMTVLTKIQR